MYVLIPGVGLVELQHSAQLIPGAGVVQELAPVNAALAAQEEGSDSAAITGVVQAAPVESAPAGAGSGKLRRNANPRFAANEVDQWATFKPVPPKPKKISGRLFALEGTEGDTARISGSTVVSGRFGISEEGSDSANVRAIVRHSRAAIAHGVLRLLFKLDDAA